MSEQARPPGRPEVASGRHAAPPDGVPPPHPAGRPQGPPPQGPPPQRPPQPQGAPPGFPAGRPGPPPPPQAPGAPGTPTRAFAPGPSASPPPAGPTPAGPTQAGPPPPVRPPGAAESATRIEPGATEVAEPATQVHAGPGPSLSVVKVTGQAFAAVTAAGVGSVLGGAGGTVAGAGLAAIVTTVGDAVYQRSLERTRDHVKSRLQARRPARGDRSAAPDATLDGPTVVLTADDATRVVTSPGTDDGDDATPSARPWRRYSLLAATGLLIFLVALLAITGIERVKGSPLSGGESGTSVGSVLGSRGGATTTTTAPATDDSAPTSTSAPDATDGATTTTPSPARTTTTSGAPRLPPSGLLPGN